MLICVSRHIVKLLSMCKLLFLSNLNMNLTTALPVFAVYSNFVLKYEDKPLMHVAAHIQARLVMHGSL